MIKALGNGKFQISHPLPAPFSLFGGEETEIEINGTKYLVQVTDQIFAEEGSLPAPQFAGYAELIEKTIRILPIHLRNIEREEWNKTAREVLHQAKVDYFKRNPVDALFHIEKVEIYKPDERPADKFESGQKVFVLSSDPSGVSVQRAIYRQQDKNDLEIHWVEFPPTRGMFKYHKDHVFKSMKEAASATTKALEDES